MESIKKDGVYEGNVFLSAGDVLLLPIMEFAGKDISSWFDPKTEDVSADQTYVDWC